MNVDLNNVVIFVKLAESRGLTRAARALGLPKSTVSRKLAALEESLGVRLVERTTKSFVLTEAGEAYYQRCVGLLAGLDDASRALREARGTPQGILRVSAPVAFGDTFLAELLPAFSARHPAVQVEVVSLDRPVDLVAEGYDVAIRVAVRLEDAALVARRLASARLVLVASPEYLARRGEPERVEDLAGHVCLPLGGRLKGAAWTLQREGHKTKISITGPLSSNSQTVILRAAEAGLGIAQLPVFTVAESVRRGALRVVLPGHAPVEATLFVIYPSGHHLPAKVRAFVDFLAAEIQAFAPRLNALGPAFQA